MSCVSLASFRYNNDKVDDKFPVACSFRYVAKIYRSVDVQTTQLVVKQINKFGSCPGLGPADLVQSCVGDDGVGQTVHSATIRG